MSYQDGMAAINLQMPKRIPRTEYSAHCHWKLIAQVTDEKVTYQSDDETKRRASMKFEKAWSYDLTWNILTHNHVFGDMRTKMGHAAYADGSTDYDDDIGCPFQEVDEVLNFDPFERYGTRDIAVLVKEFDANYDKMCMDHPDQVNMTGIYITMVSGLLEIFGWDMLLLSMGEDSARFGEVANRYQAWIQQYFDALAKSKSEVVMIHDDIVWTSGAFANPAWYRDYIFTNYQKLFEPLHKAGKKILYTSDGTYNEFVDDIAACGVNGLIMEPTTDMDYIAKKYGKTHAFIGNADCRILTMGSKQDIKKEVERCINIGKEYPGYFMAVGNHIPSNVPPENAIYYNHIYEELSAR